MPKAFTLLDGVVVVALLAGCWGLWGAGTVTTGNGGRALVEVIDVSGTQRHPMTPERQLRVVGPLGESVLHLGPAGARFVSSPCPLQLCVRSGTLSRSGALAACLPNRVVLRVVAGPGSEGVPGREAVDAVGR
jgi:hypothetical protein